MHLGPLVRAVCRATVRLAVCGEYAPVSLSHFGTSVIYIFIPYLYPRAQRRTSHRQLTLTPHDTTFDFLRP